jgi:hypothetical protein
MGQIWEPYIGLVYSSVVCYPNSLPVYSTISLSKRDGSVPHKQDCAILAFRKTLSLLTEINLTIIVMSLNPTSNLPRKPVNMCTSLTQRHMLEWVGPSDPTDQEDSQQVLKIYCVSIHILIQVPTAWFSYSNNLLSVAARWDRIWRDLAALIVVTVPWELPLAY